MLPIQKEFSEFTPHEARTKRKRVPEVRAELADSDLQAIQNQLADIGKILAKTRETMREFGLGVVLNHSETVRNRYLPEILEWAEKLELDARNQGRARKAGKRSRAEIDREEHARRVEKQQQENAAKQAKSRKRQ